MILSSFLEFSFVHHFLFSNSTFYKLNQLTLLNFIFIQH